MRINHNIAALNTHRQLNQANNANQNSMEKLSSGLRINRAGDDAAGLAISEKMRGQIRGLEQAERNSQDGISMIQTAEGALNETQSILQRMRELAVQGSNDTLSDSDRGEIQKEVSQLKDEVDRISNTTEFNTKKLLNGDLEGAKEAQGTKLESVSLETGVSIPADSANESWDAVTIDDSNNELVVNDGASDQSITIESGTYTYGDLATKVEESIQGLSGDATNITVSNNGGTLQFDQQGGGAGTDTYTIKAGESEASDILGIDNNIALDTSTAGTSDADNSLDDNANALLGTASDQLTLDVGDGDETLDIDLTSGDAYSKQDVVDEINKAIENNTDLSGKANATLTDDGSIVLSSSEDSLEVTNTTFSDAIGITDGDVESEDGQESSLLTDLRDSEGNQFGLQAGDEININGKVQGSAISESTLTVSSTSTLDDLTSEVESAFDLEAGSVSLSDDGEVVVEGEEGTANALADIKISSENRELFNNKFSSFRETQTAQDTKQDGSASLAIGANEGQTVKVDLNEVSTRSLALESIDLSTEQGAQTATSVINNAIENVSTERSKLGAAQNRLEHTINNLGTSSENLTAAESRIRDVDMAKEMMNQTKQNILSQASQSMLAKANQQPQGVLQLLR